MGDTVKNTLAAVGGPFGQVYLGQQQAKEQRKQQRLEQAANDIQRRREKIAAVRQAQIARATVIQEGANTGTSESSGVQGAVASIGSQEAANLNLINQLSSIEAGISASRQKESKLTGFIQLNQVLTNIGNKAAGAS